MSPAIAAPEGGAPSGLIPGGSGLYSRGVQIMHEVGGATIHDTDMMRYDKINAAAKVIIINMNKKDMVQEVLR